MKYWQLPQKIGFIIPKPGTEITQKTFSNTNCIVLDGKLVAKLLQEQCFALVNNKIKPHLAAIIVGDDPASQVYVANKAKFFANAGFTSQTIKISASEATTENISNTIHNLNTNANVHGILLQLPLPNGLDSAQISNLISPAKDVDGFLPQNMGLLATSQWQGYLPCTPFGVMILLATYGINLSGKHVVVVGRSNIVGKPMALLALAANATVTIAHSHTPNLPTLCATADVVIVAVGKAGLVTKDFIKPGAVVIDVGMHRGTDGKLCGDCNPNVTEVAGAFTPVPGGVGPLTIAMLGVNTAIAAWGNNL